MKIKQFFLILALTSMATTNVKAQWSLGFGYAHTIPLFNMCEKGYRDGGGYSLSILSKPFPNYYNWQIQMGGNLNHFWAGKEKQEIELAEPANASASYKIRNRHTAISFKTRLISKPNPVRFHADLDLGSDQWTFEGWFYFRATSSTGSSFFSKWGTARSYNFVWHNADQNYKFAWSSTGSNETIYTSATFDREAETNRWVHIMVVRGSDRIKVFRDGEEIINNNNIGSSTIANTSENFCIGRMISNTNYDLDG